MPGWHPVKATQATPATIQDFTISPAIPSPLMSRGLTPRLSATPVVRPDRPTQSEGYPRSPGVTKAPPPEIARNAKAHMIRVQTRFTRHLNDKLGDREGQRAAKAEKSPAVAQNPCPHRA